MAKQAAHEICPSSNLMATQEAKDFNRRLRWEVNFQLSVTALYLPPLGGNGRQKRQPEVVHTTSSLLK